MSDYTQITNFSDKDALLSGNPEKAISGADVDGEFAAISTAIATKIDEPSSPSSGEYLRWTGAAWDAEDPGADGTAGQVQTTDGTNESWGSGVNIGTEQATTSGSTITFSSIPSWVRRITINLVGVSTDGTANLIVQIGDSGGLETSGYAGSVAQVSGSPTASAYAGSGYITDISPAAASVRHGTITLTLEDATNNTWVASGMVGLSNGGVVWLTAGSKSLSATLDRVALVTTDTLDAGAVNITWE